MLHIYIKQKLVTKANSIRTVIMVGKYIPDSDRHTYHAGSSSVKFKLVKKLSAFPTLKLQLHKMLVTIKK